MSAAEDRNAYRFVLAKILAEQKAGHPCEFLVVPDDFWRSSVRGALLFQDRESGITTERWRRSMAAKEFRVSGVFPSLGCRIYASSKFPGAAKCGTLH